MTDGPAPEPPAQTTAEAPTSPDSATATDRWLLALFGAWVLLLLVGAFAQVTDNREILDLFDLHRWFTR